MLFGPQSLMTQNQLDQVAQHSRGFFVSEGNSPGAFWYKAANAPKKNEVLSGGDDSYRIEACSDS